MKYILSAEKIQSFEGDILPLRLIADSDITDTDIKWSVSGECVQLRKFTGENYTGGGFDDAENNRTCHIKLHDRVLLTLLKKGKSKVVAEVDGEKYTCTVIVKAHKAKKGKRPQYYIGDLHVHTTMEHDHDRFCARTVGLPVDTLNYMRNENKIDFSVISDHGCCLDEKCFFNVFEVTRDGEDCPVVFAASESEVSHWQVDRFGNRHKNSGEMVVLNSDAFNNSDNWEEFYSELAHSPYGVVTLAHPQIIGTPAGGGGGVWNFSLDKNNTPEFKSVLRLIESGNGSDRSSNFINEYMYSVALDQGFKVSLTCSSDNHGAPWGYEACPGKTVIMAREKSREEFLYALRENRVYATESGNVKVYYTVNGNQAPCTVENVTKYNFHVEVDYFREDETTVPVKLEVVSDYGKKVKTIEGAFEGTADFTVESETARYFYLRFTDSVGHKTWSCPVWTGREFDKTAKCLPCQYTVGEQEELKPIPKDGFTAVDELSGKNADDIVNDTVDTEWTSGLGTASFVIDMKKEHTVRGVGHYPVFLPVTNGPDVKEKMGGFAAECEISLSLDGQSYEKCIDGFVRIYGGEVIFSFEPTKARYVKFDVKSNIGQLSGFPQHSNYPLLMNELTVFE
ncbi:MAG: discoidin domain-containing protein [Ruminococcaceae bacterium]|nr:discoidin domain-containing protein [Oscillospiraceae bacterium]